MDERFKKPFRFKCTQCGNCCKDPNTIVNLTFSDIKRFNSLLKYDIPKILESTGFYIFEETPTEQQLKQMVVPPILTQRGPAFIGLRKNSDGTCIFLDKDNKCTIYSARPNICRTFPFHFHSTPYETPKRKLDIEMTFTTKAKAYCPGIGKPYPIIDETRWMSIGKETTLDILQEVLIIRKWNKAVEKGSLEPLAENYIRLILNLDKKIKQAEKSPLKKSYKSIIREKINQDQ